MSAIGFSFLQLRVPGGYPARKWANWLGGSSLRDQTALSESLRISPPGVPAQPRRGVTAEGRIPRGPLGLADWQGLVSPFTRKDRDAASGGDGTPRLDLSQENRWVFSRQGN